MIYPLYWNRLEKHLRTKDQLHRVIELLTGFDEDTLKSLIVEKARIRTFFEKQKPDLFTVIANQIKKRYSPCK